MERTPAYWATIAQIAPVVMLALLVEGRFTARRLARKKHFLHNRSLRIAYAGLFALVSAGLFVTFLMALNGARGLELDYWSTLIAEQGLTWSVAMVFLSPAMNLGSSLVGDWLTSIHRRMPYSAVARGARKARKLQKMVTEVVRQHRAEVLAQRVEIAKSYVESMQLLEKVSGDREASQLIERFISTLDDRIARLASERAAVDSMTGAIEARMRQIDQRREVSAEEISQIRGLVLSVARG